jgi:hypothetical protein
MGWRKRERKLAMRIARLKADRKAEKFARKLQRLEMARRLDDLNHEAKRIKEAAAQSVSRELFDEVMKETRRWRDTVNTRMAAWAGAGAVMAFMLSWFLHK